VRRQNYSPLSSKKFRGKGAQLLVHSALSLRGLSLPFLGILAAVEAFISENADSPAFCQQPKQNNQRSRSLSTSALRDLASVPSKNSPVSLLR
jgi:hypothetical protein